MSDFSLHIQSNAGGRPDNQDYYASKETGQGLLVVVCDGMGGTAGGRIAAEMACDIVMENFGKLNGDPVKGIIRSVQEANRAIYSKGRSDQSLQNMGTTIAALLLQKEEAVFFHAGDSRIYQIRNGHIEKRTADHSKVGEMVRRGILSNEQARLSAESNIISKAVGIEPDIDVEVTSGIQYQKGDRFVICTDGIWGTMPEDKLVSALSENQSASSITDSLIGQINYSQYAAGGGHDNMTLALVEVKSGGSAKPTFSNAGILNIVLGLALAISLVYNFKGSNNGGNKPATTKDSLRKDSTAKQIRLQDSLKKKALDTSLPKPHSIDPAKLQKIKEVVRKLQAGTQKDTGRVKPLVEELFREVNNLK